MSVTPAVIAHQAERRVSETRAEAEAARRAEAAQRGYRGPLTRAELARQAGRAS